MNDYIDFIQKQTSITPKQKKLLIACIEQSITDENNGNVVYKTASLYPDGEASRIYRWNPKNFFKNVFKPQNIFLDISTKDHIFYIIATIFLASLQVYKLNENENLIFLALFRYGFIHKKEYSLKVDSLYKDIKNVNKKITKKELEKSLEGLLDKHIISKSCGRITFSDRIEFRVEANCLDKTMAIISKLFS